MSRSNGGMFGVGRLIEVTKVVPMINPDVDTSKNPRRVNIKPKGLGSNRISRRQYGNGIVMEDIGLSSERINLKSLISKEGYAGQIRVIESKRWKYFSQSTN